MFRAIDTLDENRIVAIKKTNLNNVPLVHHVEEGEVTHEPRILQSLDHASIVRLLDFFYMDPFELLVLEWMPDGDLFSFVQDPQDPPYGWIPPTADDWRSWLVQAADGLV